MTRIKLPRMIALTDGPRLRSHWDNILKTNQLAAPVPREPIIYLTGEELSRLIKLPEEPK